MVAAAERRDCTVAAQTSTSPLPVWLFLFLVVDVVRPGEVVSLQLETLGTLTQH